MKRFLYLVRSYTVLVASFVVLRAVFLLYQAQQSSAFSAAELAATFRHGFSMDLSVAAYLTALPALVLLLSVFLSPKICSRVLQGYYILISIVLTLIFLPDLELYTHWGFRIDGTVFTYLVQPAEAVASISVLRLVLFCLAIAGVATLLSWVFIKWITKPLYPCTKGKYTISELIVLVLCLPLLFIAIRGGITTSTMNVGRVYFSEHLFLNHAAVNPAFSLLSSLKKAEDFGKQYRYMPEEQAAQLFAQAFTPPESVQDSVPQLLHTQQPNIVFILLESFGSAIVEATGGESGISPCLDSLVTEGLLFDQMYANSFRTDRGMVATLAGFPAQPTMSLIKYPKKSEKLPSMFALLHENGYQSSFLYGGDVDFAYIKSFLIHQKITRITRDTDFPVKDLLNKWGAPDHITFPRLLQEIREEENKPFIKVFLTLSSHEPFDVPMDRHVHPYLNSVAYTDSCLGVFINNLKQTPEWDNTLLVLVPDHAMRYPDNIAYYAPERHHVFMLWAGGALAQTGTISKICAQTDIVATLLHQLNLTADKFPFSRNIVDPQYQEYAFYTFPDGFGLLGKNGKLVYDNVTRSSMWQQGEQLQELEDYGKAYLQTLYNHIDAK